MFRQRSTAQIAVPLGVTLLLAHAAFISARADEQLPPEVPPAAYETTFAPAAFSPESIFVGYDKGLVFQNDRDASPEIPFQMRVNSWLQLRHTYFDSDGPNQDQNSFSFERLRLSFGGHVFDPELNYFFQLDGNSDSATNAIFLDYYVTYNLAPALFDDDEKKFGLKAGKWKVPFSRSRAETGRKLQFSDRATADVFFDLNRAVGLGLFADAAPFSIPVHVETALFNGYRTGSVSTTRGSGLDDNIGWSLRAHTDLLGEFGNDGETDLGYHDSPALRLGTGFAWTRIEGDGATEFSRERVVDSGATLASLLPAAIDQYDVSLYTLDAHYKHCGLSVIAGYYWRQLTRFRGGSLPSLFDHGFVLQSGYFIYPSKLELIARWSRLTGDSGTLGAVNQSSDELAGGAVWYINGHNTKLTFDLTHINGAPVSSSRLDMLPADQGWLLRTQFQLAF